MFGEAKTFAISHHIYKTPQPGCFVFCTLAELYGPATMQP